MTHEGTTPDRHAQVDAETAAQSVLDAMLAAVTDGSHHARRPLEVESGPLFDRFVDIGVTMRQMWVDADQQTALIDRFEAVPRADHRRGADRDPGRTACCRGITRPRRGSTTSATRSSGSGSSRTTGMIYGEFSEEELARYLDLVAPYVCMDGRMFDLGSGLGKVVLTTALTMPFERCTGVELLPYRHDLAVERRDLVLHARDRALAELGGTLADDVPLVLPSGALTTSAHVLNYEDRVQLVQGDMFEADLTGASLVSRTARASARSWTGSPGSWRRDLPSGALVTTTTYELPHPAFRLVREFPADTLAWTTVYAYRREGRLDRLPPPPPRSAGYALDAQEWGAGVRALMAEETQ